MTSFQERAINLLKQILGATGGGGGGGGVWGAITGTLGNQTDLNDELALKQTAAQVQALIDATVVKVVSSAAHGFVVGDVLRMNGTAYVKAEADSEVNAEVIGIVSSVPDANSFGLTTFGFVSGLSGLTAGASYFLDPTTAGAITATEPSTDGQVSKPIFIATTTTAGYFFNMRGAVIEASSASYLVYTALLTQDSFTTAPVAIAVGTQTVAGTLTWTYVDVGRYRVTSSDAAAFPANKTFMLATLGPTSGGAIALKAQRTGDDTVELFSYDEAGAVELSAETDPAFFEIRVYP